MCGGGTAGSVVAARLVEAGRRVLLLEAGPDYGGFGEGRWPAELLDARTLPFTHDWGYTSGEELPGRSLDYERARVIGGCSAHNGCTVSWGHRADYDGWAALGLDGWGADDLLPLFRETSSRLRVRRFADDEIAPFHGAFIEAGVSMELPELDDLESLDGVPGVCAEPSNSPDGIRWNAAFAYLDPVRPRPELVIAADTLVDRVLVESGRAVGVAAHGLEGVFVARAELVIVAGGTYGSPAILLRSGIGPADELRAMGVEVIEDLPVGRNLHDQPSSATEPFASMLDRELEPGPVANARHDLREAARAGVIHYWHPVGTCAMGAVTDGHGHVLGIDGLVVADASVMPSVPRATTNVPTLVVAEQIAAGLSGAP